MKKIIFAILLTVISIGAVKSQHTPSDSAVFIIGTSVAPNTPTGLVRLSGNTNSRLHLMPEYCFFLRSTEKGFSVSFMHYNYNLTELAKERPVTAEDRYTLKILTRPMSEFTLYANVVNVDEMIANKTKEEVWAWARWARRRKIYIIDRNDFYTEKGEQKMKLIEVGWVITNQPHDPPIIHYE